MTDTGLEAVLRRDRAVVLGALAVVAALAWAYTLWLADDTAMGGMEMTGFRMIPAGMGWMMPATEPWRPMEFAFVFAMWAVMMIGMMTPSVAPMILIYARVGRQAAQQGKPLAPTAAFAAGYLLAWTAFSLAATAAQWLLERAALLSPMMESQSRRLGAIVLIATGIYQWLPLKDKCLSQCQAPLMFLLRHGGFKREARGSLALGLRHGFYCIGCCWALMVVLVAAGAMGLHWVLLIAALVAAEKLVPGGIWIARTAGALLVVLGVLVAANPGLYAVLRGVTM